ncbi:MAG: S41 family peptidase, partial [Flavobacteriales bacterium]
MSDRIDKILEGESRPQRRFSLLQPFLFALMLIIGIYIGFNLNKSGMQNPLASNSANANPNKLVNIINKIDEMYVDSVEKKELIDDAIKSIVDNLDPHSYYISSEELSSMQEPLEGNFEGIGVEFMIQKDTLLVVNPIEGGPSEEVGILAGDRIIKV